jgi:hypothetical protein
VAQIDLAAKEVDQVRHIHSLPVVPVVMGLSACQVFEDLVQWGSKAAWDERSTFKVPIIFACAIVENR